jgi:hypothetical protein
MGCRTVLELGPGQLLTGMVRRTLPGVAASAASDPDAIKAAVTAVTGAGARHG